MNRLVATVIIWLTKSLTAFNPMWTIVFSPTDRLSCCLTVVTFVFLYIRLCDFCFKAHSHTHSHSIRMVFFPLYSNCLSFPPSCVLVWALLHKILFIRDVHWMDRSIESFRIINNSKKFHSPKPHSRQQAFKRCVMFVKRKPWIKNALDKETF